MEGGEDGGGGGRRSNSSGALGGGSWSPGGAVARIPHLPRREWERGPAESRAQPSLQRVRAGGGGEDRLPQRGPSPLASLLPQNEAELARTRRPRRTVTPAPQAPGSSQPAASPRRPGAEGLGRGRNPARRRRRSAPTQAGFSRGARHPEIEGRDSEAAGRQGPAQKPLRPRGAPGGPAGARLRARHARLGPCAAPAARAAPPFSPACRRGSALRIPSSRCLPAPRALRPRLTRTCGRLRPGPGRGPRLGAPWAFSGPAPGAAWNPAPLSHLKFSSSPLPLVPGAATSPRSLGQTWVERGPPHPPPSFLCPSPIFPLLYPPLVPLPLCNPTSAPALRPLPWPGSIGRFLSCQT